MSGFRKNPHRCVLEDASPWFERKVVQSSTFLYDVEHVSCSLELVPVDLINKSQLDASVINPSSIINNGDFITPPSMDIIGPSDPALGDIESFVNDIDSQIKSVDNVAYVE